MIGEGTVLGARCRIYPGVVVGRHCRLGDDVTIYPNVVLYDGTVLGNRVIIHANAVIGADGFELLEAIYALEAPSWLREVPAVETLRRVWLQQYYAPDAGSIRWRSSGRSGRSGCGDPRNPGHGEAEPDRLTSRHPRPATAGPSGPAVSRDHLSASAGGLPRGGAGCYLGPLALAPFEC